MNRIGPRTKKQALFLKYYLDVNAAAYNATKAAIMAGYSERTAYSIGSELTKKPHIRAAIDLNLAIGCIPYKWRYEIFDAETYLVKQFKKYLKTT